MTKPRFVLIYDFLHEVGGLEKLMTIHAEYLKKEGYDVEMLFSDIDRKIIGQNQIYKNLKIGEYGFGKNRVLKILGAIIGFNKLKNMIKPDDIILSYSFPVNLTIRNLKNKKIVYLNHFPNFLYLPLMEKIIWANNFIRKIALTSSVIFGPILRKIDRILIKRASLIFMNSKFTKNRLDQLYNVDGIISYPPVSKDITPKIDNKILEKYSIGENKIIFASGRVIPDKRIDWLIEAFSKINDKKSLLLISGQVEDKQKIKLENLAKKLNIASRVKLLGIIPKEDLIKLYSMADIYTFSAPKEDFGLVPAEAISCGTPCIVWGDGSGPNEIIIDGVNGLYAKPYNILDFAKKLEIGLNKKWDKAKIFKSSKKFSEKEIRENFIKSIKRAISSVSLK